MSKIQPVKAGCRLACQISLFLKMSNEGRIEAKAKGVMFGRKRRVDRQKILALKAQGVGATAIAKQLGIGRSTVYLILKSSENFTGKAFPAKP